MAFDDIVNDNPRAERGPGELEPGRAPVSIHGDEALRGEPPEPDEMPTPDEEQAQSPMDSGSMLPSLPDEPALIRKPENIRVNADIEEAGALSSILRLVGFL